MALLHVLDTEGKEHLVHSSIFDTMPRKAVALGDWSDVWVRMAKRPTATEICRVLGAPGQSFLGTVGK